MTYNVLMGTLNPTHSLTHSLTSIYYHHALCVISFGLTVVSKRTANSPNYTNILVNIGLYFVHCGYQELQMYLETWRHLGKTRLRVVTATGR